MIETEYEIRRNELMINGLYTFLMNDQVGLVLYESEHMGSKNAKMIKATRLILGMTCPELIPEAGLNYMPKKNSVLHDDAAKLCAGELSCLPEVEKAIFNEIRLLPSSVH